MRFPYFGGYEPDPLRDKISTYFVDGEERLMTYGEASAIEQELYDEYRWILDTRGLTLLDHFSPEVTLQWGLLVLSAARERYEGTSPPRATSLLVRRALARQAPHTLSAILGEIGVYRKTRHELCALTAFDELDEYTRRTVYFRSGARLHGEQATQQYDVLKRCAPIASSFALFRFDSMRAGEEKTLLEQAGGCRHDWRCAGRKMALFEFQGEDLSSYSLLYERGSWRMKPTLEEGIIFLRRDFMGARHEAHGTLIVTNASVDQPLPRFDEPVLWSPLCLSSQELGELTEADLSRFEFRSLFNPELPLVRSLGSIVQLTDLLEAALQGYRRWLFDAHTLTAFVSIAGEERLVGGYKSPGFAPLVQKLRRLREEWDIGLVIYPWAQFPWRVGRFQGKDKLFHSFIPITDEVLSVLTHLTLRRGVNWDDPIPSLVVNFMQLGYDTSGSLAIIPTGESRRG